MVKRIIIADDDDFVRTVVGKYFQQKNIETELCQNGEELLEKMKHAPYDAVLTDYKMKSHLDGMDVIRQVKRDYTGITIFMMSGSGVRKEAMEAGATGYLEKPFKSITDLDILVELLQPSQKDGYSNTEQ